MDHLQQLGTLYDVVDLSKAGRCATLKPPSNGSTHSRPALLLLGESLELLARVVHNNSQKNVLVVVALNPGASIANRVACAGWLHPKARPMIEEAGYYYFGEDPMAAGMFRLLESALCATQTMLAAEAVSLGVKAGLDPQLLYSAIAGAAGASCVDGKVDWNHLCSTRRANGTFERLAVDFGSSDLKASRPSKIAFIGLVLRAAGHNVVGYDAWKPSMDRYSAGGGICSSSPEECGRDAEVLVLMVVNATQAQQALFQQCVAQALPFGASVILMSTVAPSQAIALSERLREVRNDLPFFDAPVSGGTPRAATGDLTILCAGPVNPNANSNPDGYAKVYSVLEALSASRGKKENLIHVPGGPGMGAAIKLVNQHLAGCHISSTAEALASAARLGLPLRLARAALLSGPAESWMMGHRGKHMLDGLLQPPTSMIDIFVKDMSIVVDEAARLGCAVPLASHVQQQFILGRSCGWGKDDDSR
ncbi:hypothetical protein EHS25_005337 [Saitozyma podzolica]|uniref:6-phosphogluconate dehydrogenase NADP-binding domain-containing protein n=1 Tax=Saitozyma podzolica TaxID=1890683 RepID=A0A427XZ58_9TREE|nr:hypothetical protein EHS25_005337 [Saitozyma podzolica]